MITAPSLERAEGVRHGFFTRNGGVSEGVYGSLNCGFGSADDPAAVAANRDRALARLGGGPARLLTVYQIHSADAVTVETPWSADAAPRADGMVTRTPGLALGILTADCVPVLFADPEAGVIGAAHAGWKGALGGVLEGTLEAMADLGAEPARTYAAIGPCIRQSSYEVGPEFRAAFVARDPVNAAFFTPSARDGHHMFDLPGYVDGRLLSLGLKSIADVNRDTCAEADAFFSYRRTTHAGGGDYGRNLSAIVLEE